MVGIRPVTPGTIVVLAATVLLVLVSVSVPILKSIYFLDASFSATVSSTTVSGDVTLGVWGYCVGTTCSTARLGYKLDVDTLFGIKGLAAETGLPTTLIKWLTYALILHPIAAVLAAIASLCGILAHVREMSSISCVSTTFASLGASVAILAFIFDLVIFTIAKKRINASSVGGNANYGNAIWMTLAGALLLMFAGCFFSCGARLISNRRPAREASEKNRPTVDPGYGHQMRQDAMARTGGSYGGAGYDKHKSEGGLPEFAERDGEIIPLTSLRAQAHDEEEEGYHSPQRQPSPGAPRTDVGSYVSGVGTGHGRGAGGGSGMPISASEHSALSGAGVGAGVGAAAGLAAGAAAARGHGYGGSARQNSSSHVEAFTGMTPQQPAAHSPAISQASAYPDYNYNNYVPSTPTNNLTPSSSMPLPAPVPYRGGASPSVGEYGYSQPSARMGQPAATTAQGFPNEKANYFQAQQSQSPPPTQYPQPSSSQQYFVQNSDPEPSASSHYHQTSQSPPPQSFNSLPTGPAPSYQTYMPTGSAYQGYGGGHEQDVSQGTVVYHTPEGSGQSQEAYHDPYSYNQGESEYVQQQGSYDQQIPYRQDGQYSQDHQRY